MHMQGAGKTVLTKPVPITKSFHRVYFFFSPCEQQWHLILTICHFSSMFREQSDRAALLCFPSKAL